MSSTSAYAFLGRRIPKEVARRRLSDRRALLSGLVGSDKFPQRGCSRHSYAERRWDEARALACQRTREGWLHDCLWLSQGNDRVAHETAIEEGGRTIAVLGTPISHAYPAENRELQEKIAREFLLISQVPIKRWKSQGPKQNRIFFPERNITMSALTEATIIVEAGETSGTLVQARHALKQGRKLFILDSCFNNPDITWPHRFAEEGAIRVRNYDDISRHLSAPSH